METPAPGLKEFLNEITSDDGRHLSFPEPVNAHTHCADGGLKVGKGVSLESLVAPPNGLKHRYLRDTADDVLIAGIRDY